MISLNELRVDNWVYNSYTKQNTQVYPMMIPQLHRIEKENGSLKDCNIEPIPLTEEILLKCGFEKTDDYGDQIYYEPKDRGNRNYYICFDHGDISFGLNVFGNCTALLYDDENLQFLHQLQNLYFALTGEELNIQL